MRSLDLFGNTLEPALEQVSEMTGKTFENVLVDKVLSWS